MQDGSINDYFITDFVSTYFLNNILGISGSKDSPLYMSGEVEDWRSEKLDLFFAMSPYILKV
jgi:hypothetical protein